MFKYAGRPMQARVLTACRIIPAVRLPQQQPLYRRLLTTQTTPTAAAMSVPPAAAAAKSNLSGAGAAAAANATGYGLAQRPRLASRVAGLLPSLYARIYGKLQTYRDEIYPFHIGETHLLPSPHVVNSLREHANDRDMHHYSHPQGLLTLRAALAHYVTPQHPHIRAEHIIVTHGGTHALNLACQAVLDPGDVMLVLSPHWPLINSMVHTASAVPIEVPFYSLLRDGISTGTGVGGTKRRSDRSPAERAALVTSILRTHLHPRTRAVYITSPNNPDGTVLCEAELSAIAQFCRDNHLYALVDHAYERFHFNGTAAPAPAEAAATSASGGAAPLTPIAVPVTSPAAGPSTPSSSVRVGGCSVPSWAVFDQTMSDKVIHGMIMIMVHSPTHRMIIHSD